MQATVSYINLEIRNYLLLILLLVTVFKNLIPWNRKQTFMLELCRYLCTEIVVIMSIELDLI